MATFETGKTYSTRSICDHNCIIEVKVEKRAAKTIRTTVHGKPKTLRISIMDGVECVKPWGSYSMALMVSAA